MIHCAWEYHSSVSSWIIELHCHCLWHLCVIHMYVKLHVNSYCLMTALEMCHSLVKISANHSSIEATLLDSQTPEHVLRVRVHSVVHQGGM